jgi:hypothetical protein
MIHKIFIELAKMTWLSMCDTPAHSYFIMPISLDCFHKKAGANETMECNIYHQERNDLGEIIKRTIGYFDETSRHYRPLFEVTGPQYQDGDVYLENSILKELNQSYL